MTPSKVTSEPSGTISRTPGSTGATQRSITAFNTAISSVITGDDGFASLPT